MYSCRSDCLAHCEEASSVLTTVVRRKWANMYPADLTHQPFNFLARPQLENLDNGHWTVQYHGVGGRGVGGEETDRTRRHLNDRLIDRQSVRHTERRTGNQKMFAKKTEEEAD
jgi:hypothetical protein